MKKKKTFINLSIIFSLIFAVFLSSTAFLPNKVAASTSNFLVVHKSGEFKNYVYTKTFKPVAGGNYMDVSIKSHSKGTGTYKLILEKYSNGWHYYKTLKVKKNGTSSSSFNITKGKTYRWKLINTGSSKTVYYNMSFLANSNWGY